MLRNKNDKSIKPDETPQDPNRYLFAYWVILYTFLSPADFFSKSTFQNSFSNTIRVSNNLDPDQADLSGLI